MKKGNTPPTFVRRGWFTLPEPVLAKHGVIIGGSGSGKTETLLRIAYVASRVYQYHVFYLDAKGDYDLAARFLAALWSTGKRAIHLFPTQRYYGWNGDEIALLNRLLAVSDYSEPYYQGMAQRLLALALGAPAGLPRTSDELLARLNRSKLRELYSPEKPTDKQTNEQPAEQTGEQTDEQTGKPTNQPTNELAIADIDAIEKRDANGVYNRYKAFFDLVGDGLDGEPGLDGFSFDDGDGGYILLDGLALRAQAASLGRFLIEDFAHYVSKRKHPSKKVLLIIDEFSALNMTDAANLFERIRSYNAAIIVSSQSYAALGETADRILSAANLLLLHQSSDPDWLVRRAGSSQQVMPNWGVERQLATGRGTMRLEEIPRIHPDLVRRLPPGELYAINAGQTYRLRVARVLPSEESLQEAQDFIENGHGPTTADHTASTDPAVSAVSPNMAPFDPLYEKEQKRT